MLQFNFSNSKTNYKFHTNFGTKENAKDENKYEKYSGFFKHNFHCQFKSIIIKQGVTFYTYFF